MTVKKASRQSLLDAWEAWDSNPTFEREAKRHIKTIADYAEELDIDALDVRRTLAAHRRNGLTYDECLKKIES